MIITLQTLVYFRESLLRALDHLLRPYYSTLSLTFGGKDDESEDEECDKQVFAEFDDEKGVVFFPPVYLQRYAAVSDCLMDERWCGKLQKVVDLGYHDMSFINYLKEVPGVKCILGVDIESIPLRCASDLIGSNDFIKNKEQPLHVTLFEGNAADPDYRLIGCDAVVAIEMIEHMLPHDLDRLIHTVFGFIRPWVAIFTTPNGDFNVLFKNLEKNGLRRWDHYFEWSREQFNDWCSNIVKRYPDYTVSCKGIGPGPPETLHVGCCSQMAVFVAKQYHKQQDLNLNSLALVANKPQSMDDLISSWDTTEPLPLENNMICPPNNVESFSDFFSESSSCVTIVFSPSYSVGTIECQDKMSQCDMDLELERNYLMFDYEDMSYNTLEARRMPSNRVYVIEDVASRLNCTTLLVDKFSKTTQNLMQRKELDAVVHTRDVVDEIRHLTKMLYFNKEPIQGGNGALWCNINWGENAPYWNQFYKIVREYNYPFEAKSEECLILELLQDEINRLIDANYDVEYSVDVNKLEIPLARLMRVVSHITDDVDRVKDILEWNGYEIVDNVLIHSRLVVDNLSATDDDWPDETSSDWDSADLRSTSVSDGSQIIPEYHARCLRRALDRKVRKLRMMLTEDRDVTIEMDRVVNRLMKLALRSSRGRSHPPPSKWMQCKLLDLLTLTEKAICKRRMYFIENYPLKAIAYETQENTAKMKALQMIKDDDTAMRIFRKYRHLVKSTDKDSADEFIPKYMSIDIELDNMSDNTGVFKDDAILDLELKDDLSVATSDFVKDYATDIFAAKEKEADKLERTQAWLEEDIEVVNYPDHTIENSSDDSANSSPNINKHNNKSLKRYNNPAKIRFMFKNIKCAICKKSHSKFHNNKSKHNFKGSSTRLINKDPSKSSYSKLLNNNKNKYAPCGYMNYKVKKSKKEFKSLQPTASKPIPSSLIQLCHPELMPASSTDEYPSYSSSVKNRDLLYDVAATENSQTIEIVSDGAKETIALKRNIGTDAECDPVTEAETLIRSVSNTLSNDINQEKENGTVENQAQTIFLYDINEPTTSKGIRHCRMDVQCGSDPVTPHAMSTTTSLTRIPKMFALGIKIENSATDTTAQNKECGTSTYETEVHQVLVSKSKSVGIVIKDSDSMIKSQKNIEENVENITSTADDSNINNKDSSVSTEKINNEEVSQIPDSSKETKLIKSVSSCMRNVDCESIFLNSRDSSQIVLPSFAKKEVGVIGKFSKYERPKLCCGGVQVHSYRCKQTSEDIMYQGEWQRLRPKLQKKKVSTPAAKLNKSFNLKKTTSNKNMKKKESNPTNSNRNIKKKESSPINLNMSMKKKEDSPTDFKRKINKNERSPTNVNRNIKGKENSATNFNKNEQKNGSSPTAIVHPNKKGQTSTKLRNVPIGKIKQGSVTGNANKSTSKPKVKVVRVPVTLPEVPSKPKLTGLGYKTKRSNKNTKSAFVVKKPSLISNITILHEDNKTHRVALNNYIPTYLKKRAKSQTKDENKKQECGANKSNGSKTNQKSDSVEESKSDIKKDLLKFQAKVPKKYFVLRNEIEKSSPSEEKLFKTINENIRRKETLGRRALSPNSTNSSTCSSPNSVATVRAAIEPRSISIRRYSTSSYKSSIVNSESEDSPPLRPPQKKFSKRCKSAKVTDERTNENKENIPQSSKQFTNKGDEKTKSQFIAPNQVYITQLKESPNVLSSLNNTIKSKPQKSYINMPKTESVAKKRSSGSPISTRSSKKSNIYQNPKLEMDSDNSNMVVVLQKPTENESSSPKINSNVVLNHRLITDFVDNSSTNETRKSIIASDMKQLIEETLDFIDDPFDVSIFVDSDTIVLSNDKDSEATSLESYKLAFTQEEASNNVFQNVQTDGLNDSFEASLGESFVTTEDHNLFVTDFDILSFKSINSVSKSSELLTAENESHNSEINLATSTLENKPMCEIFERKEPSLLNQNINGSVPSEIFSALSMNEVPDRINSVDSETGSLAVNRQITSEELFSSGRSSRSFESPAIDDDTVVPNWLFQILTQQQQSDTNELQPPVQLMVPVVFPVDDAMLDGNGNIVEGVGVGAGAGDGRGIHSDTSRDTSVGTSSSETSSGHQSEEIVVDPFVAQFETLRETTDDSAVLLISSSNNELRSRQAPQLNSRSFSHGESSRNPRLAINTTSDFDADISSIDTDVHDSSENLQ